MVHGHELAEGTAGVVADEGHVLEFERGEEVGDQRGEARRRPVGFGS